MSTKTAEIAKMIDMLPDSDKELAYEYKDITEAENGDFVSENDIDWDNLSRYAN